MVAPSGGAVTPVKSADRILQILELFTADPRPRTYSELLSETGFPKSSLHGLLATLTARSWLTEGRPGPTYALGIKALETGGAYLGANMRELGSVGVQQILDHVATDVGETVNLARLHDQDIVYLAVRRSLHALSLRSAVGARLPAYASAMGKAMLASWSDEDVRNLFDQPFTPLARNTVTDVDVLIEHLNQVRDLGYAVEFEEATDGIGCIAVPVSAANAEQLAISASFPLTRHNKQMESHVVDCLSTAREHIYTALTVDPTVEIS